MLGPVPDELREYFIAAFLAAWPERDVAEAAIRDQVAIAVVAVVADEDGTALDVRLLGNHVTWGIDDDADLRGDLDELALYLAYNAEGDRWIGGDGWREWRP